MSFFQIIYTPPLCVYLSLMIVLFTPMNTKKQGSANADSSLTTPNQGRCSASAREVDSVVRPSHSGININWIDH